MDVDAEHVEPARERIGDERAGLLGWKAELRAVVPGADGLMGVGIDTEGDADENALDADARRELGFVGRVEHDWGALARSFGEERCILVVPVDDELCSGQPRRPCIRQLARGGDVRADPLLAQELEQRDVRKRLRPEEDAALAGRRPQGAGTGTDGLLADDDERRTKLVRERSGADVSELELAAGEGGGVGQEVEDGLWHPPIVPVTVETVQQLLT